MSLYPPINMDRVSVLLGTMIDKEQVSPADVLLRLKTDQLELYRVVEEGRRPLPDLAGRLRYLDVTGELPTLGQEIAPFVMPIEDDRPALPTSALTFELCRDIQLDLAKPSLVKHWLDHGAASMWYGPPGQAKTFNLLHLSFCVATRALWFEHKVSGGGVVYFALEGGAGAKRRVIAIRKRLQLEDKAVPFALFTAPLDLSSKCRSLDAIIAKIREAEKAMDEKVVFVVIDTLNRALAGADENSAAEISGYIANVDRIRHVIGCHAATVHHSGKDQSRGARGSNALLGAVDTAVLIDNGVISIPDGGRGKQRDHRKGDAIGFQLVDVPIGHDEDGEVVTSAVVEAGPVRGGVQQFKQGSNPDQIRRLMVRAEADGEITVTAPDRLKLNPGARVLPFSIIRERFVEDRINFADPEDRKDESVLKRIRKTACEAFHDGCRKLEAAKKIGYDKQHLWFR